jgi:ABC-type antimicrobial peptide transport system permease subunit
MGSVVGWVLSSSLKYFDFLPVKITLDPFVLAFGFSMIVGLIFGIHPARKAASLSPDETIR